MVLGGPVMSIISYTGFCSCRWGMAASSNVLRDPGRPVPRRGLAPGEDSASRLAGAIVIVGGLAVIGLSRSAISGPSGVQGD